MLVNVHNYISAPETERNFAGGWDTDEGICSGGVLEVGLLGVSEERVRPPDLAQHFIADTQRLAVIELQPLVRPVLAEVDLRCKVLHVATQERQ